MLDNVDSMWNTLVEKSTDKRLLLRAKRTRLLCMQLETVGFARRSMEDRSHISIAIDTKLMIMDL